MTIEELEAKLETVSRERDEAKKEAAESSKEMIMLFNDHSSIELEKQLRIEELTRERDEARAEVERLRERVVEHQRKFDAGWAVLCKERDEARAEVERLRLEVDVEELDLNSLRIEFRNLERDHKETQRKLSAAEARAVDLVDEADELRGQLGKATNERDEAWSAWEKGAMFLVDAERERDSAKEWASQMVAQTVDLKMQAYGLREGLRTSDATPAIEAAERDFDKAQSQRDIANANYEIVRDALETTTRERDEARAEVKRLTDERDELFVRVADQSAELRATRDAYNTAYRRGAEAMREACANAMHPIMRSMISRTEAAQTIRALPIPEEP